MSSLRKFSFCAAVLVLTVTDCVPNCFRATAESVFILIIELGPVPLTKPISLSVSNKKIDAANPSAIADNFVSGADVAMEVCLLDAH